MRYAYETDSDRQKGDVSLRISAEESPHKQGVCPLHGCPVVSRFVNRVWQWVHTGRCLKGRRVRHA